ncbi:type VII toxin-antitoxin system HepT family RNase toxin [Sporosarcina obsidiansis]|uniref:type VII toxin-antitoxin system HepT family RNase toxin n=1 Tax=Sporosarcina obsidiansis TaxID=2660748 RepID=UPI00129A39C9|nr:DUF86 domain-containing protein [Sporosarcina obsidiansis]
MTMDVTYNKISIIERCLRRVREVYDNNPESREDFTKQDSIILNIQRACEASIDLAMHLVSKKQLGLPQTSRDAFRLLMEQRLIEESLANRLQSMVGFRNIAVHDYQAVNLEILQSIIEKHLDDFTVFTKRIMEIMS